MSTTELIFFLAGGLLMLGLAVWSMRIRDFERQGNTKALILFGLLFALLFVVVAGRAAPMLTQMSATQQTVTGLTAGSFSAGAILMFLRAYRLRRTLRAGAR